MKMIKDLKIDMKIDIITLKEKINIKIIIISRFSSSTPQIIPYQSNQPFQFSQQQILSIIILISQSKDKRWKLKKINQFNNIDDI